MIDLLQWVHKYVPGHSDEDDPSKIPVQVLNGGDYLTYERHQSAQSAMQDGRTLSSRLTGLVSKYEDFHAQCEWIKVKCPFQKGASLSCLGRYVEFRQELLQPCLMIISA